MRESLKRKFSVDAWTTIGGKRTLIPVGNSLWDVLVHPEEVYDFITAAPRVNSTPPTSVPTTPEECLEILLDPSQSPINVSARRVLQDAFSAFPDIRAGLKNFLMSYVADVSSALQQANQRTRQDFINPELPDIDRSEFIEHSVKRHFFESKNVQKDLEKEILKTVFESQIRFGSNVDTDGLSTMTICLTRSTQELLKQVIAGGNFNLRYDSNGKSFLIEEEHRQLITINTNLVTGLLVCRGYPGMPLSTCVELQYIPAQYFTPKGFNFRLVYIMSYGQGNGTWFMPRPQNVTLKPKDQKFSKRLSLQITARRNSLWPASYLTFLERFQQVKIKVANDTYAAFPQYRLTRPDEFLEAIIGLYYGTSTAKERRHYLEHIASRTAPIPEISNNPEAIARFIQEYSQSLLDRHANPEHKSKEELKGMLDLIASGAEDDSMSPEDKEQRRKSYWSMFKLISDFDIKNINQTPLINYDGLIIKMDEWQAKYGK